jgi:hypothetical protein
MRVKLSKRLGQNGAGSVIDVTDSESAWLIKRGYAERVELTGRNGGRKTTVKVPEIASDMAESDSNIADQAFE